MSVYYHIINDQDQFYNLQEEWNTLLLESELESPFLTWEWMYYWWEEYSNQFKNSKLQILIFRVKRENKLIGILPLYYSENKKIYFNFKQMGFLGDSIESSDYLDLITIKTYWQYFIDNLKKILISNFHYVDFICFKSVLEDSLIYNIFRDNFNKTFINKYQIFSLIKLPKTFNEYLKSLSKSTRENLKRKTKKLFKHDNIQFVSINETDKISESVENIFELHNLRARQKKISTRFTGTNRINFHKKMSKSLIKKGIVKFFFISTDEKNIAAQYAFDFKDRIIFYNIGFDPLWSRFSPGLVIMGQTIKYAIDNKKKYCDLYRGMSNYKRSLANNFSYTYLIIYPHSYIGFIYIKLLKIYKYLIFKAKKILHKKNIWTSDI